MLQHPYLKKVKQRELFKGIRTFKEIENQIVEHSNLQKDRGDAFEVFAEAFLKLGLNAPYKSVFPENVISADHFKSLRLKARSKNVKGIDGVLETHSGELHTYQVKFRTKSDMLTWNEGTGSVTASKYADSLLLFTNSEEIDEDIKDRNIYSIKLDFLSSLTSKDFKKIEDLIYLDQVKSRDVIQLEPYQEEAVQAVIEELKNASRTQLIMPCGSGKTIVGQRIIEQIENANVILILVPTLQLLNDTFEDYIENTIWTTFPYICVGSKVFDTNSKDHIDLDVHDLPFVSSTDPYSIRKFLNRKSKRKVVFSTYQSLPVLAEALGKKHVDVAIFDEAHNTASKKGNYWTFGLEDKNIKIKNKIIITETPRKFHLLRKNEDVMRSVFSMDDFNAYGNVAYKLTFKKAAYEYKVICKYKIIISIINSEYYTKDDLKSAGVLIGYSEVNAETIAKQIALLDAVKKNEIKKIISFHPKISHASEFVGEKEKSIRHRLDGFNFYTISSKQSAGDRRVNMRSSRNSENALISNAQCLNEGVDVPAVDMVAFMHPKRSAISIVQAVGRAIRKPRGSNKEWGYVFVPIFLEKNKNETDLQAAQRSNFKDVYEVINALRDHDEVLDDIIKKLKIEKGRTGDFEGSAIDDRIQINGTSISVEEIKSFVQSEIVDRMSPSWFEFYGQLVKFHSINKHCNVHTDSGPLGTWVNKQRYLFNKKLLIEERIQLLESLNFVWNPLDFVWNEKYEELKEFHSINKHCNVPKESSDLGAWLSRQRTLYNKGKLEEDKIKLFELLNLDWDPIETAWHEMYDALKEYKIQKGDCLVPQDYPENPQLGHWVTHQRAFQKVGRLEQNRYKKLHKLDFCWDIAEQAWNENIISLKKFIIRNDHSKVLKTNNDRLSNWVSKLRRDYNKGTLAKEKIAQLEAMHFDWNPLETDWNKMYVALKEYIKKNGNSRVPNNFADNPKLGNWANTRRAFYHKGKLSKTSFLKLEAIGFDWNPLETIWHEMYDALKEYKDKKGDCLVPQNYPQNQKLGRWVAAQRRKFTNNKISQEKVRLLDNISFAWFPKEDEWREMYELLHNFFKKHGHCRISTNDKNLSDLGKWCSRVRSVYQIGKLPTKRVNQLEKLSFDWDLRDARWNSMFDELIKFKKENKHCLVRPSNCENPELIKWVNYQRDYYKLNSLSKERLRKLKDVGFEFYPSKSYRR